MPYFDPEKRRQLGRNWRKNNKEHCRVKQAAYYRKNPVIYLLNACRSRARKQGIPFAITKNDITIPAVCPVFGTLLEHGTKGFHDNSPSIDQIIAGKGYIPGNVVVMSFRANRIKHNASLEELKKLVAFLEDFQEKAQSALSPVV